MISMVEMWYKSKKTKSSSDMQQIYVYSNWSINHLDTHEIEQSKDIIKITHGKVVISQTRYSWQGLLFLPFIRGVFFVCKMPILLKIISRFSANYCKWIHWV